MKTSRNESGLTFRCKVHFRRGEKGRMQLQQGVKPVVAVPPSSTARVPRISRLMALAIKFEGMLERGEVKDYAELARLGHVTRARVTQIMNLLMLAPDIQEAILFLPPVESGHDPIREWQVRPVGAELSWRTQHQRWQTLRIG